VRSALRAALIAASADRSTRTIAYQLDASIYSGDPLDDFVRRPELLLLKDQNSSRLTIDSRLEKNNYIDVTVSTLKTFKQKNTNPEKCPRADFASNYLNY